MQRSLATHFPMAAVSPATSSWQPTASSRRPLAARRPTPPAADRHASPAFDFGAVARASGSSPDEVDGADVSSTASVFAGVAFLAIAFKRSVQRIQMQGRRGRIRSGGTKGKRNRKIKRAHYNSSEKEYKSGTWQMGPEFDDEDDTFEWWSLEEIDDGSQIQPADFKEVAAYSQWEDGYPAPYECPEYQTPPNKIQLSKDLKRPPPVDQGWAASFSDDIKAAIGDFHNEELTVEEAAEELAHCDVVASLDALKLLMAFLDGSLGEDMRAKGMNLSRRNDAESVDLLRVTRMREAPNALVLGTVFQWVPRNPSGVGIQGASSYDNCWERATTGQQINLQGPRSARDGPRKLHYRLVSYDFGGLKTMVRAPTAAKVPAAEAEAFDRKGQGVDLATVNRRDSSDLWSRTLPTRFAAMQMGDVGMVARGVLDKGFLVDLQETTQEDLCLDRPSLQEEASELMGRLRMLLKEVKKVADAPGCKDRVLFLQYNNAELALVSPALDEDEQEEQYQEWVAQKKAARQGEKVEEDMPVTV
eukprot:TRINITY_DN113704_c0_g1_i1.p1 TRINITY_DN113704_c0_g1~~TRINITY_DN113704_c0_g1_i1.p1  ORF type:complete len:531 (+),score=148.65 TRINITY_DN113704_c0_g1_i1:74-1666(+)